MPKVKYKVNKKTGHFICSDSHCGKDAPLAVIIEDFVYCIECGQKKKAEGIVK